jgi:hypothetical protein
MSMRVPVAGLQIYFDIARTRRVFTDLDHRARKIRSAFGINETRMENPDDFPIGRFEPVPKQALMEPDGLEQAFIRHDIFVAQGILGTHPRAPGGIKIPGKRKHLEIAFAPVMTQSQANAGKIERSLCRNCLFIETDRWPAASFCWPKPCFSR